ncbi:hypothetical protein BH09BAC2_BH09BAC2_11500 [soil metagenome]
MMKKKHCLVLLPFFLEKNNKYPSIKNGTGKNEHAYRRDQYGDDCDNSKMLYREENFIVFTRNSKSLFLKIFFFSFHHINK